MATARYTASQKHYINTNWFRERLEAKGLTQTQFGVHLGLDRSTVSKMLNGKIGVDKRMVPDIATLLSVSPLEVMTHLGVDMADDDETVSIAVARSAGLNGQVLGNKMGPKRIERPTSDPGALEAVFVVAPGTPADGWVCFHRPTAHVDPDASERLAVVETVEGKRWLGTLKRSVEARGRWDVFALFDPSARPALKGALLKWAAPILWVRT